MNNSQLTNFTGAAFKVNGLTKSYNNVKVLDLPSLEIAAGETFGLVGNNGAGKTTFFRLILDLIRTDGGELLSFGHNVASSERWKNYTGSYLDEGFVIDFLTPEEYFDFVAGLNGLSKGDVENFKARFEEFFNGEILGKKKYIRDLSKGNQKKVGIAAAMMTDPQVLILDEPFTNLDPSSQIRLKKMLREEREKRPVTMLISSHDLNHVTEVCQRIVVLEKGHVVHDMQTNESTLQVLEAYFAG
ncbi:MAG: ABC transporter ATP-binding protein [Bacteroidales bacterium]|nr:ABC transporter ATP-binding protein [Bacteroidales bacterium]MDD3664844.1 ABC transporter ATP-binding protein [Bacteroidales bacterium]